ncbi:phosphoglycerate mutase-like protein 1 [Durio zibethinus]|uniref:Phosphoglycerate mutase-like protein 1 n=1 Tax=Durio zibethinus TaxID=66656 RepID=A0A6P5XTB7_DURZI|nr:phosphoglycerate mutase-like protein 1 [Durio zibethinus]
METTAAAPAPYLHGSQKLLHLVRHAQGLHNLEAEKRPTSIDLVDPELSSQGWQQVRDQRKNLSASGLLERIEVVITSPLLRTLQTSVGIFGGDPDRPDHVTPLQEANIENDGQRGISTFNRLPIIASELCRERKSKNRQRGTLSQCRSRFPAVDFSLIESEDDVLWESDERETNEAVAARGIKFIKWLLGRKEKEIAVVSHGVFLQQTMIALRNKCYPLVDGDFNYSRFGNCEIRSVIIFNESVMGLGSDSLTTSYQAHGGRITRYGLQLQNDSAEDNVPVDEATN